MTPEIPADKTTIKDIQVCKNSEREDVPEGLSEQHSSRLFPEGQNGVNPGCLSSNVLIFVPAVQEPHPIHAQGGGLYQNWH